jgi:maleylpyruvate isomerase
LVATDSEARGEVAADGPELAGPVTELAAWLVGRSPGVGLAVRPAGAVPLAPRWV